jgi:hypothetical protein
MLFLLEGPAFTIPLRGHAHLHDELALLDLYGWMVQGYVRRLPYGAHLSSMTGLLSGMSSTLVLQYRSTIVLK